MPDDNKKTEILIGVEILLFILLVSCGITGSSFGWLKNYPGICDVMELAGERKIAGVYRGIRCDEFLHQGTASALAQYHAPEGRFPRFNSSIGITVRDLTIYHDTGVPVWHFVTLARPALWGFFAFDLRRALSFYWFFPLFFALWGCHFLLNTLFEKQKFFNGLLSLSLVLSPVCAAWSFWPAGNMGGACWAAGLFLWLFKVRSVWLRILFSFLAVWCGLCSVMTLYVPRIYPVLCLLAVVVICYLYEEGLFKSFREKSLMIPLSIFSLLGIAFLLYFLWDCRNAISLLTETSYPGQRRLSGGTMGVWSLVQGYLAPLTVYKVEYLNQCELTGPLTLIFPLILLCRNYFREQEKKILLSGLILFCLWTFLYQFAGIGSLLGKLTFWSRCNPQRCDLALCLAQILLVSLLFYRMEKWEFKRPASWAGISLLCCLALLISAPCGLWKGLLNVYPLWYLCMVLCLIAIFAFLLFYTLLKRSRAFSWIFCCGSILPGLIFNPVNIAPYKIINRLAVLERTEKTRPAFLFLGEKNFCAVAAWAAGSKVFNGYFLYPDPAMRTLLFGPSCAGETFNCISNYDMIVEHTCKNDASVPVKYPCRVEGTGSDHIRFLLPCRSFDYSLLGVQYVAVLHKERPCLQKNPSLTLVKSGKELDFYRVKGDRLRDRKTEGLFKEQSQHEKADRNQG